MDMVDGNPPALVRLLLMCLLLSASACSATVVLKDGTTIEGDILSNSRSDPDAIYVRTGSPTLETVGIVTRSEVVSLDQDTDARGFTVTTVSTADGATLKGVALVTDDAMAIGEWRSSVQRISRSDIDDIDHPGTAILVVGGVVTVLAAMFVIAPGDEEAPPVGQRLLVGGFIFAVEAVPFLVGGYHLWRTSTENAEFPGRGMVSLNATPLVFGDGERPHLGGGLKWRW